MTLLLDLVCWKGANDAMSRTSTHKCSTCVQRAWRLKTKLVDASSHHHHPHTILLLRVLSLIRQGGNWRCPGRPYDQNITTCSNYWPAGDCHRLRLTRGFALNIFFFQTLFCCKCQICTHSMPQGNSTVFLTSYAKSTGLAVASTSLFNIGLDDFYRSNV